MSDTSGTNLTVWDPGSVASSDLPEAFLVSDEHIQLIGLLDSCFSAHRQISKGKHGF